MTTRRQVVIYEINEVPWTIWDLYLVARPDSNLAAVLDASLQSTTVDNDPIELMPWRTWPTFHYSSFTEEHNAFDQGQDPASFHGVPIWDVVDQGGLPVGLFGVLQSWPPHEFRSGGFYVPDSFALSPATFPPRMERFQAFNIAMTNENAFAAQRRLGPAALAGAGIDVLRLGLTPWSASQAARHLLAERRDARNMAARPTVQVLPCFDLYWRLHRKHHPALSIFFSNHVASMMHRFWGDWVPGYASNDYKADPVYRTFILRALDYFDHQIGTLRRWVDRTPGAVLIVAGSIGQGPIEFHTMSESYVLDEPDRLLAALGFTNVTIGTAMYPRVTAVFETAEAAEAAQPVVLAATSDQGRLFNDLRLRGSSLSFEVTQHPDSPRLATTVSWADGSGQRRSGPIADLGLSIQHRPGGGNTAHHTPDGALFAYGSGIGADSARAKVDILDVAPSILQLLGLEAPPSMRGRPSMFPAG